MSDENRCAGCGGELAADAPQGLCPACLLKRGLESQTGATGASQPADADYAPPTPAELAAYFPDLEILELIGRGGMGVVYKARQKRLDRLVALKILSPKIGQDPAFAERFAREARAMAMLSHPHIVAVHDFGQTGPTSPLPPGEGQGEGNVLPSPFGRGAGGEGGLYYFLMEFVDGVNLRRLLDAGKLSPQEALAIVPQICDALQYAHDAGVVHRDIKPENILLDKSGRVKIADFGLAKLMRPSESSRHAPRAEADGARSVPATSQPTLTAVGQVMGTPQYMAPEQIEHPKEVDHRADIYSLGVVFYQMLTGELPIGRFAPPSKKVQIDVRLDEVVLRALEKEPALRYQQASDLKTRVETISTTPPVDTSPRPVRPASWRRHFIVVGRRGGRAEIRWPGALLGFAIVIGVVVVASWLWVGSVDERVVGLALIVATAIIGGKIIGEFLGSVDKLPSLDEPSPGDDLPPGATGSTSFSPRAKPARMFGIPLVKVRDGRWGVRWPGVALAAALLYISLPLVLVLAHLAFAYVFAVPRPGGGIGPNSALFMGGAFLHWILLFTLVLGLIMLIVKVRSGLAAPVERPATGGTGGATGATAGLPSSAGDTGAQAAHVTPEQVADDPAIEQARQQVKGPAIGLLITGILNLLPGPLAIATFLAFLATMASQRTAMISRVGAPNANFSIGIGPFSIVLLVAICVVPAVLSTLMIVAALKMKRLRAYGLAIAGSILAIVSPGFLIGLPIGIWALVVLSQREVRAAFGRTIRPAVSHLQRTMGIAGLVLCLASPPIFILFCCSVPYGSLSANFMFLLPALEAIALILGILGRKSFAGKFTVVLVSIVFLVLGPFLWLRWMSQVRHDFGGTPSVVPLQPAVFGPVIERTVETDIHGKYAIDLDTGILHTPPANLRNEQELNHWIRAVGADAVAVLGNGLSGRDMLLCTVPNVRWDENIHPVDMWDWFSRTMPSRPGTEISAEMPGKGPLPVTYMFKTREGSMGLLQIVGFSENPAGVKIRYKLVQPSDAKELHGDLKSDLAKAIGEAYGKALGTKIIKQFGPADKLLTADGVAADKDGWRIEAKESRAVKLFEIRNPDVLNSWLQFSADLQLEKLEGPAHLVMWCRMRDGNVYRGNSISPPDATSMADWVPYTAVFKMRRGDRPELIEVGVVIDGHGTLDIKNLKVDMTPLQNIGEGTHTYGPAEKIKKFDALAEPSTTEGIVKQDDGWRIEAKGNCTIRLFDIPTPPHFDKAADYALFARLKLKTENLAGRAYLKMGTVDPEGKEWFGDFSFDPGFGDSRGPATGTTDWTTYETPDWHVEFDSMQRGWWKVVKLNLVIEGHGTVWLKDVELLSAPELKMLRIDPISPVEAPLPGGEPAVPAPPSSTEKPAEPQKSARAADMRAVVLAALEYATEHPEWPDTLDELPPKYVDAGKVALGRFVYHPPSREAPRKNPQEVAVLAEKEPAFAGGQLIGFADGYVEFIRDAERLKRLFPAESDSAPASNAQQQSQK